MREGLSMAVGLRVLRSDADQDPFAGHHQLQFGHQCLFQGFQVASGGTLLERDEDVVRATLSKCHQLQFCDFCCRQGIAMASGSTDL